MFKPYQLATIEMATSPHPRVVEVISMPYFDFDRGHLIQVRMVPGEPTTATAVRTSDLKPYDRTARYCHIAEVTPGSMPIDDMLRYDCAATYDYQTAVGEMVGKVVVYAVSERARPPWTMARWESFGCTVRHVLTRELATEKVVERKVSCSDEARAYLKKAAEESIFYVALGRCLKRDMALALGLDEETVGGILSTEAVKLVDDIRML